ncbi:site-specific integrase [Bacillus sp. DJP31]|uniref:site-specific integrase n=1 Tax=Bacillus sp. DJP31 TaxID=3409789 RepID=UPI003BB67F8C
MNNNTLFDKEIYDFKTFMMKNYKASTTLKYSQIVLHYLNWNNDDNKKNEIKSLKLAINAYMNCYYPQNKYLKNARAALHLYFFYKTGAKYQPLQIEKTSEFIDEEILEYVDYLTDVVGLTDSTLLSHKQYLKRFLYYIPPIQQTHEESISIDAIQKFIVTELIHLKPSSKKRVIGILRSYIRYLQFKGVTLEIGLLSLPLRTPVWRYSNVPKTLDIDEITSMLASYNLKTAVGLRDYAIALSFTELGLRALEVASLTLEDFNWREGKILIRKTKTHTERELPLSTKIGEAIFQYLKNSRPKTAERTLFVRFSHKCGEAMGREQIRGTIRRAYARAGISSEITGTHILRHSKAKNLYESGSSLKIIADILGHESIDTTVIYTKVGLSSLQSVTSTWPDKSILVKKYE